MLSQSLSPAPAAPDLSRLVRGDGAPVEWAVSGGYVDYPAAVEAMEARAAAIAAGQAAELVWLLEHPPSTPPGFRRRTPTCWNPAASRSIAPDAAASSPTTAPVSGWPM